MVPTGQNAMAEKVAQKMAAANAADGQASTAADLMNPAISKKPDVTTNPVVPFDGTPPKDKPTTDKPPPKIPATSGGSSPPPSPPADKAAELRKNQVRAARAFTTGLSAGLIVGVVGAVAAVGLFFAVKAALS